MHWTIKQAEAGMMIREFLRHEAQFSTRYPIKAKSEQGKICVNGSPRRVTDQFPAGDKLMIQLPEEIIAAYLINEVAALDMLYEDKDFCAVNKPSGPATIPSSEQPKQSIANRLLYYYERHLLPYTIHIVT